MRFRKKRRRKGYILLEVMIAVGIFAIGVIGLAECLNNCLEAEVVRAEMERARVALENRMLEIQAGEVQVTAESTEDLVGHFEGMKLTQKKEYPTLENEDKKMLQNMALVTLTVAWQRGHDTPSRDLSFYIYEQQNPGGNGGNGGGGP